MAAQNVKAGGAFVEVFISDKTQAQLNKISQRLRKFASGVRAVGKEFTKIGGAIVAPLALAARHFAVAGDELTKASLRTGVAVKQLGALKYAAEQSGAGLDTLETALKKMSRVINDASTGSKEASDSLTQLGVSLAEIQGLSPDKQFKLIGERLNNVADATTRAALAQEIFGRSGTQLLPLLAEGAGGIAELEKRYGELNLMISGPAAAAATRFGDNVDDIVKQFKRMAFEAGLAVANGLEPYIGKIQSALASGIEWVKNNHELIVTIGKVGAVVLGLGLGLLVLGKIAFAFVNITIAVKGLSAAVAFLSKHPLVAVVSAIGLVVSALTLWKSANQETAASIDDLSKATDELIKKKPEAATTKETVEAIDAQIFEIRKRMDKLRDDLQRGLQPQGGNILTGRLPELIDEFLVRRSIRNLRDLEEQIKRLQTLRQQFVGAPATLAAGVVDTDQLAKDVAELEKLMDKSRQALLPSDERQIEDITRSREEQLSLLQKQIDAAKKLGASVDELNKFETQRVIIIGQAEEQIRRIREEAGSRTIALIDQVTRSQQEQLRTLERQRDVLLRRAGERDVPGLQQNLAKIENERVRIVKDAEEKIRSIREEAASRGAILPDQQIAEDEQRALAEAIQRQKEQLRVLETRRNALVQERAGQPDTPESQRGLLADLAQIENERIRIIENTEQQILSIYEETAQRRAALHQDEIDRQLDLAEQFDALAESQRRSILPQREQEVAAINDQLQEQIRLFDELSAIAAAAGDVAEFDRLMAAISTAAAIAEERIRGIREEIVDATRVREATMQVPRAPAGIFNIRALQSLLSGDGGGFARRTAKATEDTAKALKRIEQNGGLRFN